MASSLYNLALDFSKELNYTKAIMARQGDKGITVTVKPFLNGLQMDTSDGTFTLKGTTPSGRYVDSVATSVTSEEVVFSLDGTFMSEPGYYQRCYVEFSSESQVLTTQDIIFFSLGVSDITQGQAAEYVSQLEALIKKYNETFEQFMDEIENQSSQIQNDLNAMSEKAEALKTQMDGLQEQIAALDLDAWKDEVLKTSKDYTDSKYEEASQTFVAQESLEKGPLIFKNTSITTEDWNDIKDPGIYYCAAATGPNMPYTGTLYGYLTIYNTLAVIIQKYEFQGAMYMRTYAGNPAAWDEWKKIAFSSEVVDLSEPQSVGGIKNFVDGLQMTGKEVAVQDQIPLCGIHGEGTNLSKIPNGTKIPIGPLVATDFGHEVSDLPYTISSDRNTLTTTRACVLLFEGTIKIHGDNTLKYAYVKIRKNGSDTNFTSLGSSVNFNYMTAQSGQYVHTLAKGDKVEFTIETASGGVLYATQLLSLKITEVKPV
ncbi:hypothetical protein IGI57_002476 [Enterococcus sp. DIV0213j]